MTLTEVLPGVNALSREEKMQLIQMVSQQLALDQHEMIIPGQSCPVWSPFSDHAAAEKMLKKAIV